MTLPLVMLVLAGVAGVGIALFVRVGARGERTALALARMLHAAAAAPRVARLSSLGHAWVFRRAGGRALGHWFGAPVLVIETVGRRSGQLRRTPIIYARDNGRFVVTPANAGAKPTPSWWLNARAAGVATAYVGSRRIGVRVVEAEGAERDRLWRLLLHMSPSIAHYQDFTTRPLPVVVLEPWRRDESGSRADAAPTVERNAP